LFEAALTESNPFILLDPHMFATPALDIQTPSPDAQKLTQFDWQVNSWGTGASKMTLMQSPVCGGATTCCSAQPCTEDWVADCQNAPALMMAVPPLCTPRQLDEEPKTVLCLVDLL
jgi:hypothetical protein